ncbi:unnamed protein product [Nezara viridula]|uniref:Uncharacterized protein n=1 Tax=Nezara viridula TaxID=85310 RepID=A0A9P0DZB9_NEZVI|nr:unnamed protein product [Nezara viridula]
MKEKLATDQLVLPYHQDGGTPSFAEDYALAVKNLEADGRPIDVGLMDSLYYPVLSLRTPGVLARSIYCYSWREGAWTELRRLLDKHTWLLGGEVVGPTLFLSKLAALEQSTRSVRPSSPCLTQVTSSPSLFSHSRL